VKWEGRRGQSSLTPTIWRANKYGEVSAARATSSAEIILGEVRKHKRGLAVTLAALILLVGAAGCDLVEVFESRQAAPFLTMKITRLTSGGKIGNAAIKGYTSISPDGKYVVFRTTERARTVCG